MALLILGLFLLVLVLYGLWTNRQLDHEQIQLNIKDSQPLSGLTVTQVSDIHLRRLRVPMETLLTEIAAATPDVIILTGDTIDRTEDLSQTRLSDWLNEFAAIAPTYVIEGNHEETCQDFDQWRQLVLQTEATLLENEVAPYTFNGQSIGLVGLRNEVTDLPPEEKEKLSEYEASLLLVHHPEYYQAYLENFQGTAIATIFAGHAHGGQIRLPLLGGILGPDNTIFPKYSNGLYHETDGEVPFIVSRGLGNSRFPLRINNKPHLITVTYRTT